MHWLNQVIWFDYIYTVISQLWRLQSQPLHCWWNLGGPTRSCTMEKTWNSDQSLVIQRWARRLLPLALVECSWERWQSLVVFCWLMFEMDSWRITNLIRSERAPTAITSMIGLLLSTKTFGLGNWKIQLSIALQNHISILGVQLFGLIWPNNVMENHLSSVSRNNASDGWWLIIRRDLQLQSLEIVNNEANIWKSNIAWFDDKWF